MPLVRRLFAALSSILLLQLSLLGSGTLCAWQHRDAHRAMGTMSGRMTSAKPGAVRSTMSSVIEPTDAPGNPHDGCGAYGPNASCGGPWSAGSCTSMSSCSWSQSAAVVAIAVSVGAETGIRHPDPLALLAGPAIAPELPPPRV